MFDLADAIENIGWFNDLVICYRYVIEDFCRRNSKSLSSELPNCRTKNQHHDFLDP